MALKDDAGAPNGHLTSRMPLSQMSLQAESRRFQSILPPLLAEKVKQIATVVLHREPFPFRDILDVSHSDVDIPLLAPSDNQSGFVLHRIGINHGDHVNAFLFVVFTALQDKVL